MSVQLILKPQNVQGFSNVITAIDDNVVSNGLNFTDLNSSGTYTAAIAYDYCCSDYIHSYFIATGSDGQTTPPLE